MSLEKQTMELFLLLFGRLLGFFLFSPLFSRSFFPFPIRLGLSLVGSFLLAPPLSQFFPLSFHPPATFLLLFLKEILIGYLFGLLFAFLFEAALLAGQVVGVVTGFSAVETLDPMSQESSPLMSRVFLSVAWIFFLALDLHHPLLRLLYESFLSFPISLPQDFSLLSIAQASNKLFHYALSYAIYPLTIMLFILVVLALFSRDLPLFLNGLPLQILVGFILISITLGFMGQLVHQNFWEFFNIARRVFN